jgi:hypothetical protein
MMTILLPSDIEGPLTAEAQRQGTTPELLALDSLPKLFMFPFDLDEPSGDATTLFDFLDGYIGTIEGSIEAFSENRGQQLWPL